MCVRGSVVFPLIDSHAGLQDGEILAFCLGGFRYHGEGRHKPIGQDNEQCDSHWREETCYRSKTRQGL